VATPQAARGWARPPCRHFKIQSCSALSLLSSQIEAHTPPCASTCVTHSLPLAGLWRCSALANPTDFDGASPIFTCLGYVWVWASWFGFLHGGSLLPGQVLSATSCAVAAANVTLAQSFGIMSYGVEYFFHRHRRFNFGRCFNRGLAALVASNAFSGCACTRPPVPSSFPHSV
jgi:hypothetical protein